jgi:hypothetical protein
MPNRLTVPPMTASLALKTARLPTPAADIAVPAGQALVGALAVGLLVVAGGVLFGWPLEIVGKLAVPAMAVAFAVLLWTRTDTITDTLTERIETFIGADINGGGIGQSPPHYVTTNQPQPLDAQERQNRALWRFLVWAYRTKQTSLEAATAAGFTESAWTDCKRVLDAAGVTAKTRAGESAGWRLTPDTAQACWAEVLKGQGGFYLQ